ncbi:unnamed protein product [Closterium sp. Naga37s-1]|nr:unnamed protein product [Closterium sp. Naga37s-1]
MRASIIYLKKSLLPFSSSLQALDWAHTHSIRVIVCLHAAPGSQNGWEHSASRDGIPMWGKPGTPYMDETVDAVRFLVQRYASHPAFAGLEPINEPRADAVSFDDLARYYERCYAVLREHSPSAYFVISGRIFANEREWDDFMTSAQYTNVIYDAHWYQVHDHAEFGSQSVDFNLQYPSKQRAAALSLLERGQRLVFVDSEVLQQEKPQQQLQQQQLQQQQQQQQRLEQRLSHDPTKGTKPAISASQRLAENANRLHDLLLQLSTAQTLDEKDAILSADPRVRAVFPQQGSSLGKFVKPAVSMALDCCTAEEIYLIKCLVASGQGHLLDTPVAWAEGLDSIWEKAHYQSSAKAGSGGVKGAFSMLASMIDGWDTQLDTPRSALPALLAGFDNPSVFPAPLMDLIDWEDRRSAHGPSDATSGNAASSGGKGEAEPLSLSSTLFAQLKEGLEYPSVFGAPLLDLVDWERQWHSDDDLASDPEFASQAAFWGLEGLPAMAEIYPLGGAGDRLGLVDEATGESLPVAMLPYCGRTLLHGLLRDLEAREYLHLRVFGEQHVTPVAIMTSAAKKNHQRVLALLQQHNWFGRGEHNFRLFQQPLVPTVAAEDGRWLAIGPLSPVLKPGGHGVIWKLAADEGVFDWLRSKGRKAAVIRQISNPLAATDMTLLALSGVGLHGNKKFGFASCDRNVGTAEGVNVLAEQQQANSLPSFSSPSSFPNPYFTDIWLCIVRSQCGHSGGCECASRAAAGGPIPPLPPFSSPLSATQKFGFASCDRNVGTAEGVNVLAEQQQADGSWAYGLTCIEYTEFEKLGISDAPVAPGSSKSKYPANTNVLFADLHAVEAAVLGVTAGEAGEGEEQQRQQQQEQQQPCYCYGHTQSIRGGRLECTMQNIADLLVTSLPYRLPLDTDTTAAASSVSPTHNNEATVQEGREGRGGAQVQGERGSMVDSGAGEEDNAAEESKRQVQAVLDTFLVYNDRRKVTSSAKRRRKPTDTSLHQVWLDSGSGAEGSEAVGLWDRQSTASISYRRCWIHGSFLDLNRNSLELFSSCGVAMPHMHSDHKRYVDSSPPFIFLFHPALGPLWSIIRQKVQGGSVAPHSEVKLEIAELAWSDVHVSGSLLIEADAVTGSLDPQLGTTQLGQGCGRCQLHNVTVTNRGVDWDNGANVYWQDRVQRKEALRVVLRGDAEFEARDVAIVGDHVFDVPEGHRMVVFASDTGAMQTRLEKLPGRRPTWEWQYSVGDHGSLQLTLVEKP